MQRAWLVLVALGLALLAAACSAQDRSAPGSAGNRVVHPTTSWQLEPSLKYDALCLLNVLSGDPFYLQYYKKEYDHFHPLFQPQEQAAFVELKRILKDNAKGIVSATLTLYYSVVADETLPQMIRTAHDPSLMKAALQETPYWRPQAWRSFEKATPALEIALRALDRVGFPAYWAQAALPQIQKRIAELSPELPRYDIVPPIENDLGFRLASRTITVYVMAYSEPHGIRVTGLRFLTHLSYSINLVLHNAIHESMHPPFDERVPGMKDAIDVLSRDPLIVDKVKHHDPSLGYNTPQGLIEEDSVEALEQIVSERFGAGRWTRFYWYQQDQGIHVLAPVIYQSYKAALREHPEPYSRWFVTAVHNGRLQGSVLKTAVSRFFFGLR